MIAQLQGELVDVGEGVVWLRVGSVTYEILIPTSDDGRWRRLIGQSVSLYTHQILEAQGQGNVFIPRLIGFASTRDKSFFSLFTTVKGIGQRKALRAMAAPTGAIAAAIASRDVSWLKTLPEIGKRTAETIIAELNGKVDPFIAEDALAGSMPRRDSGELVEVGTGGSSPRYALAQEALAVLLQLGETRAQAQQLIDRTLAADESINDVEALIAAVYRAKTS